MPQHPEKKKKKLQARESINIQTQRQLKGAEGMDDIRNRKPAQEPDGIFALILRAFGARPKQKAPEKKKNDKK